ncbi:unnamed protein product [Microthlaspi erraticum]|uniref:Uncharacterized protein n=1 Tax=Microthlaspi erraticum TaxID=1685480 RepID=A0A6D2HGU3_9BRAS|nr:unnamed protein product [Microthlaspi erraticum]
MSDKWVVFIDFKEHESEPLEFGAIVANSVTLSSFQECSVHNMETYIERILKRQPGSPKPYNTFMEIHDMLNNRIWIGHDIIKRDICCSGIIKRPSKINGF